MSATVVFLVSVCIGLAFDLGRRLERRRSVDYKKRWTESIKVIEGLTAEGSLPRRSRPERHRAIAEARAVSTRPKPPPSKTPIADLVDRSEQMSIIHKMASWDRRDLEIARARKGLPRVDDLKGMAGWDVKSVLVAHAQNERLPLSQ